MTGSVEDIGWKVEVTDDVAEIATGYLGSIVVTWKRVVLYAVVGCKHNHAMASLSPLNYDRESFVYRTKPLQHVAASK